MTTSDLTHLAGVRELQSRVVADAQALAGELEHVAGRHFAAKRERERVEARVFMETDGTDAKRRAAAKLAAADVGLEAEAAWEAKTRILKLLELQANVTMNIARTQTRM